MITGTALSNQSEYPGVILACRKPVDRKPTIYYSESNELCLAAPSSNGYTIPLMLFFMRRRLHKEAYN